MCEAEAPYVFAQMKDERRLKDHRSIALALKVSNIENCDTCPRSKFGLATRQGEILQRYILRIMVSRESGSHARQTFLHFPFFSVQVFVRVLALEYFPFWMRIEGRIAVTNGDAMTLLLHAIILLCCIEHTSRSQEAISRGLSVVLYRHCLSSRDAGENLMQHPRCLPPRLSNARFCCLLPLHQGFGGIFS